jgi:hypothetical protein
MRISYTLGDDEKSILDSDRPFILNRRYEEYLKIIPLNLLAYTLVCMTALFFAYSENLKEIVLYFIFVIFAVIISRYIYFNGYMTKTNVSDLNIEKKLNNSHLFTILIGIIWLILTNYFIYYSFFNKSESSNSN